MDTLRIKISDYQTAQEFVELLEGIQNLHTDLQNNSDANILGSVISGIHNKDRTFNVLKYAPEIVQSIPIGQQRRPGMREQNRKSYYTLKPEDLQRLEEFLTPEDIQNLKESEVLTETISWQSYYVHLMLERGLYEVAIDTIKLIVKLNYHKKTELEIVNLAHNFISQIFAYHIWDDECQHQSNLNQAISKFLDPKEHSRFEFINELHLKTDVAHMALNLYELYKFRLMDEGNTELFSPSIVIPEDAIEDDMKELMLGSIK